MRCRTRALGGAIAAILVVGVGCASRLPRYAWHDAPTAIRTMNRRDRAIQTCSATCRILMESEGGRVELTGALVARPPNHLRLRAWKFSQVVFDITLNEDGLFVLDKNPSGPATEKLEHLNHARFIEAIALLPGFGRNRAWQTGSVTGDNEFTTASPLADQRSTIECTIDKHTLVRKQCVYRDDIGRVRQSLDFNGYVLLSDAIWPMHVVGSGKQGSFVLLFDRIDLNVELAARAFDPPRRAVRQP